MPVYCVDAIFHDPFSRLQTTIALILRGGNSFPSLDIL
jgi:hypothetical protein